MTKKVIKLLSQILALLLILSLIAGCGAKEVDSTKPANDTTTTGATSSTEPENKIKWSGTISVAPYMFSPVDKNKDVIKPLLEEALLKYGYDVDLQNVFIENADYDNLMNIRIISGDAPDIFEPESSNKMREYYRQGAIASWDKEFFIENCPSIYEYVMNGCADGRLKDYVDMFWEFAMVDGKMVTIPPMSEQGTSLPKCMIMRGDWLENLGVKEPPRALDEFIELMYRFTKEDPDKDGKPDTFGFSTSVIRAIFGAFYGYTSFPDPKIENRIEFYNYKGDNVIVCGDVLPTNKQALEVLRKCYADGVIDPQFIAQKGENESGGWAISQPFINGRIGASCHCGIDHYRLPEVTGVPGNIAKEWYAVNNNYNYVYAPWPMGPEGNYGGWTLGPPSSIGDNVVYNSKLNKDTEKLAAILQIMDLFCKDDDLAMLAGFGVEGTHFEYTGEGDKKGAQALMTNEEMNTAGVWAYRGVYGGPSPMNEKFMRCSYYNSPSIINMLTIQAQEGYRGGYNRDVYDTTASTEKYRPELISYRDEIFIKIIKGELDVDYYDTYVAEYMKRGGEILTKEAQEWWDERH